MVRPPCARSSRSKPGYALLVTLVMLSLLAIILGGLARRSAERALQARDTEEDMRQRWAELSCSRVLLLTAAERKNRELTAWLESSDPGAVRIGDANPPKPSDVFYLELAGLQLWGRIDDEQCKRNLNRALALSPDAAISPQQVLDGILSPARSQSLRLTREPFVHQLGLTPLVSWAQLLPENKLPELLGGHGPQAMMGTSLHPAVADRVTLWGDGRLNIWTASNQTIRDELAGSVESETIEKLLELKRLGHDHDLGTLILNATPEHKPDRAVLSGVLTDRSTCYSLWLAVRPDNQPDAPARWSHRVFQSGQNPETRSLQEYRW